MPTLARRSSNMSLFRFFSQGTTNEFASSTKNDPCSFPMMRYSFLSISSGHLQPDRFLNSMMSPLAKSVFLFLIICFSFTSYVIQDCFLKSRSSSRMTSPITAVKIQGFELCWIASLKKKNDFLEYANVGLHFCFS